MNAKNIALLLAAMIVAVGAAVVITDGTEADPAERTVYVAVGEETTETFQITEPAGGMFQNVVTWTVSENANATVTMSGEGGSYTATIAGTAAGSASVTLVYTCVTYHSSDTEHTGSNVTQTLTYTLNVHVIASPLKEVDKVEISINEGETVSFPVTDVTEGFMYYATGLPEGLVMDPTGLVYGTPSGQVSEKEYTVTATHQASGLTFSQTYSLTVESPASHAFNYVVTGATGGDGNYHVDSEKEVTISFTGFTDVMQVTVVSTSGGSQNIEVADGSCSFTPSGTGRFIVQMTNGSDSQSFLLSVGVDVPIVENHTVTFDVSAGLTYSVRNNSDGTVSFTVGVASGFTLSGQITVTAGGTTLEPSNDVYTVSDISSDVTVTISGNARPQTSTTVVNNTYLVTFDAVPGLEYEASVSGSTVSFRVSVADGYVLTGEPIVSASSGNLSGSSGSYTLSNISRNVTVTIAGDVSPEPQEPVSPGVVTFDVTEGLWYTVGSVEDDVITFTVGVASAYQLSGELSVTAGSGDVELVSGTTYRVTGASAGTVVSITGDVSFREDGSGTGGGSGTVVQNHAVVINVPEGLTYTASVVDGDVAIVLSVVAGYTATDIRCAVDGSASIEGSGMEYTLSSISSDVTVEFTAAVERETAQVGAHYVTFDVSPGLTYGIISNIGGTISFETGVAPGFTLSGEISVSVDGREIVPVDGIYTLSGITGDTTVTIAGQATAEGGSGTVVSNTVTFDVSPGLTYGIVSNGGGVVTFETGVASGFTLSGEITVSVDGREIVPVDGIYTLSGITGDTTVVISGQATAEGGSGTVVSNIVTFEITEGLWYTVDSIEGDDVTFTVSVAGAYRLTGDISIVCEDGTVELVSGTTYRLTGVTADTVVSVTGELEQVRQTVTVTETVTVNNGNVVTFEAVNGLAYDVIGTTGTSVTFTVAPMDGYDFVSDSIIVGANDRVIAPNSDGSYTVSRITDDVLIRIHGDQVFNIEYRLDGVELNVDGFDTPPGSTINGDGSAPVFSATFQAMSGYSDATISVYMGGIDVTSQFVDGSEINLGSLTGNLVIVGSATQDADGFPWIILLLIVLIVAAASVAIYHIHTRDRA